MTKKLVRVKTMGMVPDPKGGLPRDMFGVSDGYELDPARGWVFIRANGLEVEAQIAYAVWEQELHPVDALDELTEVDASEYLPKKRGKRGHSV